MVDLLRPFGIKRFFTDALSSVCLSIDMSFAFNPHDTSDKCNTLPIFACFFAFVKLERLRIKTKLNHFALTAVVDQTRHKKGRRAKPRNWFYIFICGGFESKLL